MGQQVFFVVTTAEEGRVNVSPKGTVSIRVIYENKIVWLNMTGSENEIAANFLLNDRMKVISVFLKGNQ